MIAVIFEVNLKSDGMLEYFNIAAELATQLSEIDGFISIERFQSLNDQHRFVSLSFWKDEHAVQAWREQMLHQQAQAKGRTDLFDDYRIRVAEILRDYGMENRSQAPK